MDLKTKIELRIDDINDEIALNADLNNLNELNAELLELYKQLKELKN